MEVECLWDLVKIAIVPAIDVEAQRRALKDSLVDIRLSNAKDLAISRFPIPHAVHAAAVAIQRKDV
jgi:hypothetical protein